MRVLIWRLGEFFELAYNKRKMVKNIQTRIVGITGKMHFIIVYYFFVLKINILD